MPQSLVKIYVHLVFATKYRTDMLRKVDLPRIHAYMAGTLSAAGCVPIVVGGTENHVHALFVLNKNAILPDVVRDVKRTTSRWIKSIDACYDNFMWQEGYGAFSLSRSSVEAATNYINNQEEHHRRLTYTDELRMLCRRYDVPFDERYED